MKNIIIWCLIVLLNVGIAYWNNKVRLARIKVHNTKQIEHFWYGLGYFLVCAAMYFIVPKYFFIISLLLLHASIFPMCYNECADNPLFFISKTSTSLVDRFQIYIGSKTSALFNILSLIISITLLIVTL